MAKKKPEIGLTDQFLLLAEMEERQAIKEAKRQRAQFKKDTKKGIKRLRAAAKAASDRLTHENTTAGGEFIQIDINAVADLVSFNGPFEFTTLPTIAGIEEAAWTNGNLALVPEHQQLAVKVSSGGSFGSLEMLVISQLVGVQESWIFMSVDDLVGNFVTAEQGTVPIDAFVDPIVEWLDGLGLPVSKPAKKSKKDKAEPAAPEPDRPAGLEFVL